MKKLGYIGIDQYGQYYKIDKSPRKELLTKLGHNHAEKMYVDTTDGKTRHAGYIISGLWINIYSVCSWKD